MDGTDDQSGSSEPVSDPGNSAGITTPASERIADEAEQSLMHDDLGETKSRLCTICGLELPAVLDKHGRQPTYCEECKLVKAKGKGRGIKVHHIRQAFQAGTYEDLKRRIGISEMEGSSPIEQQSSPHSLSQPSNGATQLQATESPPQSPDMVPLNHDLGERSPHTASKLRGADMTVTPPACKRCGICNEVLPLEEFKSYGRSTCSYCMQCDRLRCCKKYKNVRLDKLKQGVQSGKISKSEAMAPAAFPHDVYTSIGTASMDVDTTAPMGAEETSSRQCYLCNMVKPTFTFATYASGKVTPFCESCDGALRGCTWLPLRQIQIAAQKGELSQLPPCTNTSGMTLASPAQKRRCNLCLLELGGDHFQIFPSGSVSSYCVPCEHLRRLNKKTPVNNLREALRNGSIVKGSMSSIAGGAAVLEDAPPAYQEPEWACQQRASLAHSCADAIAECMQQQYAQYPPNVPVAATTAPWPTSFVSVSPNTTPSQSNKRKQPAEGRSMNSFSIKREASNIAAPPGHKLCNLCDIFRPEHDFKLNKRGVREPYCSGCERLRSRAFIRGVPVAELRSMVRLTSVDSVNEVLKNRPRMPLDKGAYHDKGASYDSHDTTFDRHLGANQSSLSLNGTSGGPLHRICSTCHQPLPLGSFKEALEALEDGKTRQTFCASCASMQQGNGKVHNDLTECMARPDEHMPVGMEQDCKLCGGSFTVPQSGAASASSSKKQCYCHSCRSIMKRAKAQNITMPELRDAMVTGTLDQLLPRKRKHSKSSPDGERAKKFLKHTNDFGCASADGAYEPPHIDREHGAPVLMSQSVLLMPSQPQASQPSQHSAFAAPVVAHPQHFNGTTASPTPPSKASSWRRSRVDHQISLSIAEAHHPAMYGMPVTGATLESTAQADKLCAMCGLSYTVDFFRRAPCGKMGYCMVCERLRSRANNKKVLVQTLRDAMASGTLQHLLTHMNVDWTPAVELAAIASQMATEERRAKDADRRRVVASSDRQCDACKLMRPPHLFPSVAASECKRCSGLKKRAAALGMAGDAVLAHLAKGTLEEELTVLSAACGDSSRVSAEPAQEDSGRKRRRNRRCGICEQALPASEFRVTSIGVAEWCNRCSALCERAEAMDLTPDEVRSAVQSGAIEFLLPPT